MRSLRAVILGLTGLAAMGGCGFGDETAKEVVINGALYVEMHQDMPCNMHDAPTELAGVGLTFRGPTGAVLGRATSGEIGFELLEFGEGKAGWANPGCRFISHYSATVTRAESYEVSFQPAAPVRQGEGSWFTGVDELESQVIGHDELASQGFAWDFEVPPSYVVGH